MIIYIYDIKSLQVVARPIIENYEEFKRNPIKFYPNWSTDNNISSEVEFNDPKLINGIIFEKTREDKILIDNKLELLQDGEIIEDNKIVVIPKPNGYNIQWINQEWIEIATLEEQEKILRENIINKTSELARIQTAGFGDNKLELEIKKLREKHMEITHELATQIENIEIVGVVR
ncbi:hypothetical protein [Cetobacterium sp.]|uniref:hypothetical protein n=1 Tax=Cetobacterium sp. TaxID=2071632 RepID=UPI003EE715DE